MNELQTLMDAIAKWSDATFGEGQKTIPILYHLQKEVSELMEAVTLDKALGRWSDKTTEEFADCFMLLIDAATHHGITAKELIDVSQAKLEINKNRKWGKPDENGVIEHLQ